MNGAGARRHQTRATRDQRRRVSESGVDSRRGAHRAIGGIDRRRTLGHYPAMTTERDDSTVSEHSLAHRRGFLEALGAAVGVSVLAGCTGDGELSSTLQPAVGTTPVKWVDFANVDLRTAT